MLVYGDSERLENVEAKQSAIQSALEKVGRLPPGVERHATLVSAFISTSELVQGVLDAEFEARSFDTRSRSQDIGMKLLMSLARSIEQSWRSGFMKCDPPAFFSKALLKFDPSQIIRSKQAEGYAFYALYPESYLEAAMHSGLGRRVQVIGIRSIGVGLSAIVAAALKSPLPFTIRPIGHPFSREVRIDPAFSRDLATFRHLMFTVVDEGPGLSGSSFGAVADWLESEGVSREHIHFFPSHPGKLGPHASQDHRDRWSKAALHTVNMDGLLLGSSSGPHNLITWVEELIGPVSCPLQDLYHGTWRDKRYPSERSWPPADIRQERRKFLACAGCKSWLIKFIGLDEWSMQKVLRANRLYQAGFAPEIAGYRYGFLVERWYDNAQPANTVNFDRRRLVEQVGAYLGFRARHFPSDASRGASLKLLGNMARYNTKVALGRDAAQALEPRLSNVKDLDAKVRRVDTDNRMQLWEWQVLGDRLIKTDALDHSATHDLVGHQDIAWDVAGAIVELSLTREETALICTIIERACGHLVDPDILDFMCPCYLAFHMGSYAMASDAVGETQESARLRRASERYASELAAKLTLS
jgi:hypothetical protein